MDTVSVNQFRDNLKTLVEQPLSKHEPLRVTRRSGEDFVVLGAEDWESAVVGIGEAPAQVR